MNKKDIMVMHINQYPLMQIEDMFKLFHQASFGPAHFNKQPSLDFIMKYLDEELSHVDVHDEKPSVMQIGDGYVRIDLLAIKKGEITKGDLAQAFYQSMLDDINRNQAISQFKVYCNVLLELITDRKVSFDDKEVISHLKWYIDQDYPAVHHSKQYQSHYTPHYRVVHINHIKHYQIASLL